jgi:hypothetical protein
LISGASIAGLASAFWLQRAGWSVTVLERSESFRDGGQNVDLRGVARDVLDRMGLTEDVRAQNTTDAQNTTEQGTVFVDAGDRVIGEFPADAPDGLTAEFEILRGDLARIIRPRRPRRRRRLVRHAHRRARQFPRADRGLRPHRLSLPGGLRGAGRRVRRGRGGGWRIRGVGGCRCG